MIHISNLHGTPLLAQIGKHALASLDTGPADATNRYEYAQLCSAVLMLAIGLISVQSRSRGLIGGSDLGEAPVLLLLSPDARRGSAELAVLGILAAGGLAVPLNALDGVSDHQIIAISERFMRTFGRPDARDADHGRRSRSEGRGIILYDSSHQALAERIQSGNSGWALKLFSAGDLDVDGGEGVSDEEVQRRSHQSAVWTRDLKLLDQKRGALALMQSPSDRGSDNVGLPFPSTSPDTA